MRLLAGCDILAPKNDMVNDINGAVYAQFPLDMTTIYSADAVVKALPLRRRLGCKESCSLAKGT